MLSKVNKLAVTILETLITTDLPSYFVYVGRALPMVRRNLRTLQSPSCTTHLCVPRVKSLYPYHFASVNPEREGNGTLSMTICDGRVEAQ